MPKELRELLDQINAKKTEVKNFVAENKIEEAKASKEELKSLQDKFDVLYDLYEEEKENNQIIEKMDVLREEWSNLSKKLAFYIEHDEIEKVDTSIVEINEYIKLGLYDEAIPEIRKCSFILEHIKNKGELQVINLF